MMDARKPGPLAADKIVVIVREDDGGSIADQLEHAGVIESAAWFSVLTLLDGKRSTLKRGEYLFKAGISMNEIESLLASQSVVQHKLTIPEGLTSDQVVAAASRRRRPRRRDQGGPARRLADARHLLIRARRHAAGRC